MGELGDAVAGMFAALDEGDVDAAGSMLASDGQGIDEISKRWIRGDDALRSYVRQMMADAKDVHSEMRDVHEVTWGDTGLVTCWLEQDYTLGGERVHVSAPTTCVLRKDDGMWKAALFHSAPLPDA